MNTKRVVVFSGLFILGIIFVSMLVSAAPEVNTLIKSVQDFFKPILTVIFGADLNGSAGYLFEQLLFALIIIAACYMALDRVPVIRQNSFALWTITIALAVLSVRYIATKNLIQTLLMPQGAFGVALLSILPLAMYFWFVEFGLSGAGSRVLRKICWILYAVVFAFLWYKQFVVTSPGLNFLGIDIVKSQTTIAEGGYIYLLSAIAAVLFLWFDGTIQTAMAKSRTETQKEVYKSVGLSKLNRKFEEIHELWLNETNPQIKADLKVRMKEIEDTIKEAHKRQ